MTTTPVHTPVTEPRPSGLRRDSVLVALGCALLSAAVAVSSLRARTTNELDWSVFGVGLAATVGLLAVGLAARVLVKDADAARNLTAWPLSFGSVAAAIVVGVYFEAPENYAYIAGAIVAAGGVLGYVLAPSAAPALTATGGLALLYGQAASDVLDTDTSGSGLTSFVLAVAAFVVVVTALAWMLPPARIVVPVTAGAGAVVLYAFVLPLGAIGLALGGGLGGSGLGGGGGLDDDVYVTLAASAALVVLWLVAGYLSDHPGFKVLIIAITVTVVPSATLLLAVEHPTWWALVLGGVGGVVLVVVGLAGLRSSGSSGSTGTSTTGSGSPNTPPHGSPSPPSTPPYGSSPGTPPGGTPPPPSYLGR
ncbi:hypothetical protein GCM10023340_00120 [Nocardioides marinquilinus]|uniref:DMT family transporter n=1 Tax=Nocardioides marinquilinus TaxID=1210400 RepID=A0ABP9P8J0_9ACTN